jgi:glycerol kinase
LLDLFGLPLNALPKSVPSRYAHGALQIGAQDVPLELATGDQSAALFGFGEPTPVTAYVNLGTGAFLQQVVGPEPIAVPGLLSSVVYQDQAQSLYVLEGTVNGAGSAILKITDELGMDREYMKANSAKWLDEVTDPPLFLNGVGGLGAPYWIADFPTRFISDGDDTEKISAVIESIVFLLAANLETFALHDPAPERLVVTGGLATIDPMCQRLADLTGLPVMRPQEQEATAQGLAYLLADRPPRWPPAGAQDTFITRSSGPIHERYQRWRTAMQDTMDALT